MAGKPYLYRGFIETLATRFDANVSYIQAMYNFDYGDEFEVAVCQTLAAILPGRFGVCRGHVVNANGDQAGDDILVFDRFLFPTLRLLPVQDFSRKQWVPIEAVYAYIEAKHTLVVNGGEKEGGSLLHACNQVSAVKQLLNTRAPVPINEIIRHVQLNGADIRWPEDMPKLRNPAYAMILSRFVKADAKSDRLTDPIAISKVLGDFKFPDVYAPECIVAGDSIVALPGAIPKPGQIHAHLFYSKNSTASIPMITTGVSFGVAVCVLMTVLEMMQLGSLPWRQVLEDALLPERQPCYKEAKKPDKDDMIALPEVKVEKK